MGAGGQPGGRSAGRPVSPKSRGSYAKLKRIASTRSTAPATRSRQANRWNVSKAGGSKPKAELYHARAAEAHTVESAAVPLIQHKIGLSKGEWDYIDRLKGEFDRVPATWCYASRTGVVRWILQVVRRVRHPVRGQLQTLASIAGLLQRRAIGFDEAAKCIREVASELERAMDPQTPAVGPQTAAEPR